MNVKFPLSILLIGLLFSCGDKDNCDTVQQGENFSIEETSKVHLSNYFDSEKVIFINIATGAEEIFDVNQKFNEQSEYTSGIECPNDPDQSSPLKGTSEYRQIQLKNLGTELTITMQHLAALDIVGDDKSVEQIFILKGPLNELNQLTSAENGLMVVTPTAQEELFTTITDSLIIDNKIFFNVYQVDPAMTGFEADFIDPNLEIKYTAQDGIIYIKDNSSNKELLFDRTE